MPVYKASESTPSPSFSTMMLSIEGPVEVARLPEPAGSSPVNAIEVGGPYEHSTGASDESLARIFTCGHRPGAHLGSCRRRVLASMARRAFRRPVSPAEVAVFDGLAALAARRGEPLEEALAVGIQAILVSPDFLFRIERDRPARGIRLQLDSRVRSML